MSRNQDFAFLHYDLPPDIARRKAAGDLKGAIRLIDIALGKAQQPEMAARLRCERVRLERLPQNYPYSQDEAKAMMRQEWPDMTDAQFQHLLDAGHIDWRIINGRLYVHDDFMDTSRIYPEDAPGLKPEVEDTTARDQMLDRMEAEGGLAARITIKAEIQPREAANGRRVQAWLPIPAACPQQSEIELLDYTEGAQIAPEDAPQRTIYWDSRERDHFSVTYRYLIRAPFVNVHHIVPDKVQPSFFLNEEAPISCSLPTCGICAPGSPRALRARWRRPWLFMTMSPGRWTTAISPTTSSLTPSPICAPGISGATAA